MYFKTLINTDTIKLFDQTNNLYDDNTIAYLLTKQEIH